MGLRCSLLGHDYGESFVERDREERGNEVVVTERELRECARCGGEKVATENTEVRTLEPEPDAGVGQSPDAETATSPTTATPTDASNDGFTSPTDAIEQAEAGAVNTGDDVEDDDDAVILDADADDSDPRSEQWDEPADTPVDATADADAVSAEPSPDLDQEDVEFVETGPSDAPQPDPEPDHQPTTSAETGGASADAGATSQSASQAGRAPGEWPEPDGEDEGFDAESSAETEQTAEFQFGESDDEAFVAEDTGFTSAGPIDQSDSDDLDFALFCPECGFERYAAGSSLRAGDICPECKRGYLAEDR